MTFEPVDTEVFFCVKDKKTMRLCYRIVRMPRLHVHRYNDVAD